MRLLRLASMGLARLRHRFPELDGLSEWIQAFGSWFSARGRRSLERGYFWLPCPTCGTWMSGEDWLPVPGEETSIPANAQGTAGHGICTACSQAGVGTRAWEAIGFCRMGGSLVFDIRPDAMKKAEEEAQS